MSGRSSCPECGTNLRIRDRSFVGRRVSCPECKTGLRVVKANDQGEYVIRRLTPDELASQELVRGGKKAPQDKIFVPAASTHSFLHRVMYSPLTAAWLLAIAISILVAVLALAPKHRFAPGRNSIPVEETKSTPGAADGETEEVQETVEPNAPSVSEPPPETSPPPIMEQNVAVSALEPVNCNDPLPHAPAEIPSHVIPEDEGPTLPPAPPKVDVEGKLSQKLLLYKQSKPVSRRDLIEALQEHLGAPIFYDDDNLGSESLSKTMTFELENTTVGGVLKTIADSAGWTMEIETTGLRLKRE